MDAIREAHLTPAERAYVQLFKDMKDVIPHHDASVFQQPIQTHYDILRTLLFQSKRTIYNLNERKEVPAPLRVADSLLVREGEDYSKRYTPFTTLMRDPLLNGVTDFYTFKTVKQFTDFLCKNIVSYIPNMKFPEPSSNPINKDGLDAFLRHYRINIDLLLKGPPHADEHTIDPVLADEWIAAQETPERQRLARRLIDNTIYISHTELLKQIKICVEKTRKKLIDGPVTFIVGYPEKSNYYVSLLFYHYWKEAGLPLDSVDSHMHSLLPGNLIDIDEMAYSGTQTTNTLRSVYGSLIFKLLKEIHERNTGLKEYNDTRNFFPIPILEYILHQQKINYCVVRFFCSEDGKKELLKMPPGASLTQSAVKPPFTLIVGREIPSLVTLFGKENATKLSFLFGPQPGNPATTAYFNHKVADLPSTFLNPLSFGAVPERILWGNHGDVYNEGMLDELNEKEKRYFRDLLINPDGSNAREVRFLPFIRHCGANQRKLPKSFADLVPLQNVPFGAPKPKELTQDYRCPYAWYKDIDYETGTYKLAPNVPLPYGPTEENFAGGKRSGLKKRKTHKHKRRVKQKTKSHSK